MSGREVEAHLQRAERRLAEALGLRSRALQPRFAQAAGLWKDAPVAIATRTYDGDAVGYMRVAMISGTSVGIASLLLCARPNRALPILVMDLASRGAAGPLTMDVDLVPVSEGVRRDEDCRSIARLLPDVGALRLDDSRPSTNPDWCSSSALHARVGEERVKDALRAADRYVDAWITMAAASVPAPETADGVRLRQQAFMSARREDAATRSLLGAMFGRAWADEYLASVLYPDS